MKSFKQFCEECGCEHEKKVGRKKFAGGDAAKPGPDKNYVKPMGEEAGEKDACYKKVKRRFKVWPSAYASGALVQCRKKGAANWGNKSKK
jgi:hypothetical protein